MKKAPIPNDDLERLKVLENYNVLDTEDEQAFDEITKLASLVCETKIALVSLVDRDRQWFKSKFGLDASETPRDISYCGHAIMSDEIFVVENAEFDERFCDNPLFLNEPNVRFYAGAPLITPSGHRIGTLCVIDDKEKSLKEGQKQILKSLAKNVVNLLELKLKTEELKKMQEEQGVILSGTKVGVWQWDLVSDDLTWDDSMYELFSAQKGQFLDAKDTWEHIVHPDYIDKVKANIDEAIKSKDEYLDTFAIFTPFGETRYLGSRAKIIRDSKGKAIQFYGVNWDKTEEHAKALELKTYNEAINSLALVSKTDVYGRITYANKKFQELSLYTEEELLGHDHRILNSGHHSKEFFKDMWDTLKGGKQWRGEICNRAKDGSLYWVDTTITPTIDSSGKILEFMSFRYDITKQKEQELKQRKLAAEKIVLNKLLEIKPRPEEKLEEILSNALDIVMEVSWLKLLNKAGVFLVDGDFLKLTVSHNLGEKIENICRKVDKGRCLCGRAFSTKEVIHAHCVDERHENRFDGISPHGHYNVPILQSGKVVGVIVYYLEHGHQKNDEEVSFLKSCSEVFSSIIELYRFESEIIQSRDEALAAERAKSLFLANMSHEIRTPMNGIIGMLELLGETNLSDDQLEMLRTSESCSQTLLSILNDILDLSKIESGKLTIDPIRFNLKECIEQAIHLLSFTASQKYIDVIYEWNVSSGIWFMGDITRIRQILINLISNALKFTEKGSVTIRVNEILESSKSSQIEIQVIDTGIGISDEVQRKLFEDFTQADQSTTRKFGGTGLGLAICKRLVKLMDGSINLESEEGKGSTFIVNLELKKASEYISPKKDYSIKEEISTDHQILLVEDNKMNQKIAVMMLKKIGLKCDIANNGLEGLEAAKKGNYSLVLMDMQMPIMDGIESTKKILSQMGSKAPIIVAMTANAFADDKERCFDAGMSDFIAKPIKLSELKRVFSKL